MSLKYCLNLILVLFLFSCNETNNTNLTAEEKKKLSETLWSSENEKHGFNFAFQGTPIGQTLIDEIIGLDSTNTDALRERSVPFLKRGIPKHWKPYFDQAVKYDAKTWQPWRGYLYLWFYRDYKKAIEDFNASDTLTPNFVDAPQGISVDYWRGVAYLGLKDYENSLAYFNKLIDTETEEWGEDNVEVTGFLYRGIVLMETGETEKALKDFDKVLLYNRGQSADAKYYKALILKETDINIAEELIESAIQDFKNGYFNQRPYVETMRQIYLEDLELLQQQLHLKS